MQRSAELVLALTLGFIGGAAFFRARPLQATQPRVQCDYLEVSDVRASILNDFIRKHAGARLVLVELFQGPTDAYVRPREANQVLLHFRSREPGCQ